ncbi:ubiquitin-like protein 7 [Tribolium castaneum]|uniref:ubiquitin-like protein 7 n=1 Tax=Tribolium castaneum TaxID=7070 RepID=UPI0030FE3CF6
MAGASVVLGIWDSFQYQSYKIENVDLDNKVELLKNEAVKKLNTAKVSFDLVYCGLVLEEENTLSSYGVKPGVTIHIVKKNAPPSAPRGRALTETEVQQLVVAFRAFTLSSGYRAALQRLSRPEVLETIIAATPGLADDPAAIAIIQDPELIVHMADPDTVRRVADKHPSLIEAANYIAAHIHEEQANADSSQAGTSTGYSYSLEALSDDEEMDTSIREPHPLTRNTSYNAITAAQLAAAIANATNTAFNTNSAGMPSTPSSSNVITNEMFSNAIQQAVGSLGGLGAANPPNRGEEESLETITRRLQPQLQQMHEIGLRNDSVNIRALQATSGDVEAAIDLVFNGAID